MRKAWFLAAVLALVGGPALAADPAGNWLVKDQTAIIRIAPCADAFCGTIAWTSQPGLDENNPDPTKRDRPIVGTQILLGMKPAGGGTGGTGGASGTSGTGGNRWDGEIYNPENGKTYSGHIILLSPDLLRIEGCLLIFCGGENWTRSR
jgi:uncharacterized protein (DUF2147 family)